MTRRRVPMGSKASPTPMGTTQTAIAASLARAQRPVIVESASSVSSDTGVSENHRNGAGISLVHHPDPNTSNTYNMNSGGNSTDGHGTSDAFGPGPAASGTNQDYHGAQAQHQVHDASYHAHYPTTEPRSPQQATQVLGGAQDHEAHQTGDNTSFTGVTNGTTFGYGGNMDGKQMYFCHWHEFPPAKPPPRPCPPPPPNSPSKPKNPRPKLATERSDEQDNSGYLVFPGFLMVPASLNGRSPHLAAHIIIIPPFVLYEHV